MKKNDYIKISIIIILNMIVYLNLIIWRNDISIINLTPINKESACLNTENSRKIVDCSFFANLDFFKKNIEFNFEEFQLEYLNNDYNIFLLNFKRKIESCELNCDLENNYFKSKIHCLSKATGCDLEDNYPVMKEITIIEPCKTKCTNYYFNNANNFLKKNLLSKCKEINGENLFTDKNLINDFNLNHMKICENIEHYEKYKAIKLRSVGDDPNFSLILPYNNGFYKLNGSTGKN